MGSAFELGLLPVAVHTTVLVEESVMSRALIIDLSALFVNLLDGFSVAIEVGRSEVDTRNFISSVEFFENLVVLLSGGDLVDQILVDIRIVGILIESVKEIVNVDVSGINRDSLVGVIGFVGGLEMLGDDGQELLTVVRSESLEGSDGLVGESQVSPLHNVRSKGGSLNFLELLLESPGLQVRSKSVLHPVNGEFVTEAGSDLLSVNLVVRWAVGGVA